MVLAIHLILGAIEKKSDLLKTNRDLRRIYTSLRKCELISLRIYTTLQSDEVRMQRVAVMDAGRFLNTFES